MQEDYDRILRKREVLKFDVLEKTFRTCWFGFYCVGAEWVYCDDSRLFSLSEGWAFSPLSHTPGRLKRGPV